MFPLNRYNLFNLVDHFDSRGLYRSIFLRYLPYDILLAAHWHTCHLIFFSSFLLHGAFVLRCHCSIMEGEESLHLFSPEVRVQDPSNKDAVSILPPITMFHGTADYSIPSDARLECS